MALNACLLSTFTGMTFMFISMQHSAFNLRTGEASRKNINVTHGHLLRWCLQKWPLRTVREVTPTTRDEEEVSPGSVVR